METQVDNYGNYVFGCHLVIMMILSDYHPFSYYRDMLQKY